MKIKSYFAIFSLFVVLLCCVSAISAVSDDTMNNTVSEVEFGEDSPSISIDEQSGDVDQKVSASSTQEKINVEPTTKTFTQLHEDIHQPMTHFFLYDNYTYSSSDSDFKEGITIDRFIVIHGHGLTIDASKKARIFTVNAEGVEIHDVTFKNAYTDSIYGCGAAISGPVTVINCTFLNNEGHMDGEDEYIYGGAMYGGTAINCTFIKNKVTFNDVYDNNPAWGGAMYTGTAINCTFIDNSAMSAGGALYNVNAINCTFIGNSAGDGGAMQGGSATNCNFTGNNASNLGGALYLGNAINCTFKGNKAAYGGALGGGDATNCIFIKNEATCAGGAMSDHTATLCIFINNTGNEYPAMYHGTAILCIFENNSVYGANIIYGNFNASDFTATYDSGDKFTFDLICDNKTFDGCNATVEVYQDNNLIDTYYALSGANGGLALNLAPGNYEVVLSMEKAYVHSSSYALNILTPTKILADNITTIFNKADELLITLVDYENKTLNNTQLTVNFNNVSANYTTNESGQVKIDLKNLAVNNYTATIAFAGNESYAASNASVKITVNKDSPNLTAEPITATYNVDKEWVIILKDSQGNPLQKENLTVDFGSGDNNYKTDVNGQVRINVAGLVPKVYAVSIKFAGNENYTNVGISSNVTVNKDSPNLAAEPITATYNVDKELMIILKDSQGNPIQSQDLTVNFGSGDNNYRTDVNGQVKINVAGLVPKVYAVSIKFAGNENYTNVGISSKVTVNKAAPKLIAKKATFKVKTKTKKYKVTLKNNKGKALKKAVVTLKVKGKTYKAKTNNKGVATFKITKLTKKGTFKTKIAFKGNSYYKAVSKSIKIKVK